MRRAQFIVSALVAGTLLVPAAPAVHAGVLVYRGGCGMDVVNDTTAGGQLGGQNVYSGFVYVTAAVVTDGIGTTTSITCELKVNGVSQGTVLSSSGTGVVSSAGQLQFTADDWDVVTLCTHITAGDTVVVCGDVTDTQVEPQPIVDLLDGLLSQVDPTMCPVLAALAPGVPGVADIDPTGDTQVLGGPFWDCPPYEAFRAGDDPAPDPDKPKEHHKHKDPSGQSGSTDTPRYPSGTITMSQSLGGPVTYNLTGFTPASSAWTCTPQSMSSMSCTPPAPPAGQYDVCGTVTVSVRSIALGTVAGSSACATGVFAAAESVGPATNPSTDSASPYTQFPWTCAANPGSSLDWTVTCTVGP